MPSEKKKRVLPPPAGLDFVTPPKDSLVDDLRYALEHAKELYSDIAWDFTIAPNPTIIYAHKAILYARSSRSFQERFLKNKDANGMSIRSVRLSNPEPTIVKTDAEPFLFRQELKFFYTGEEGSEEFLAAVDTTDELEQDKLKEDFLYMFKSKLYTDVELVLDYSDDSLEVIEEDDEAFKPIKIRAHRFMLFTRSEYFKKMLNSNFIEARSSSIHLDASIFNQTSLNIILSFIYTGSISSKPLTLETCEWVWIGADFLGIKLLCDECIYRIATKVHYFACTCAECQVVVPRVAIFAKEHDVDMLWQGCLHVLSQGFDNMWPQKAFADLDEDTREEVLFTVLANIQNNNIMAIFKGCRKILSNIDIKGIGLPWIETIRGMTHRVQSFTVKNILVDNFEQICNEDQEFLDCVDGVGFSSDLLEDIMNVVVEEGLTEQNAARVLKCITGKLLTRQAVMDSESFETKRVLVQAKQNVFDYIKKRWISVKENGGFRLLSPMLLDEFSKELGITNQELQESTDHKEIKPKRTPSVTNGLSKKGRESSPAPTPKVTKSTTTTTTTTTATTTPLIVTTPPQLNTSSTGNANSNSVSGANTNVLTNSSSNSSAESSSMGNADTTAKTNAKKGKSVRIGETTTAPAWARPTRASVLRQKALAESSAKNPVKPRTKTTTSTKPTSSSSSTQSKPTTSVSRTSKTTTTTTTRTPRQNTSTTSLRVPNGSPTSQRGRSSNKQNHSKKNTSAASSRASSISSVTSLNSPSVSPSRFGGVRQTRSSMLRQLKYDDAEQRRGRDRERDASPTSSRASSIASTSSVTSTTTSSSHHRRKRSPSQNSSLTSITSTSSGAITCLQPKPHQIKLATIPNPDISVGRRVILPTKNNAPGVIQFLGETEFAKGIWVGIELENPVGKNNGKVANTKYFTAGTNHGIFVRPDSLLLI